MTCGKRDQFIIISKFKIIYVFYFQLILCSCTILFHFKLCIKKITIKTFFPVYSRMLSNSKIAEDFCCSNLRPPCNDNWIVDYSSQFFCGGLEIFVDHCRLHCMYSMNSRCMNIKDIMRWKLLLIKMIVELITIVCK